MKEIQSPQQLNQSQIGKLPTIFLAGSIEMNTAERWQERLVADLQEVAGIAYNPRRDSWDSSWEQSINNPEFARQVNWEEDHLTTSDLVIFYFDPTTKSPITIGELNLIRGLGRKAVVLCPEGFWRKGNIDIACARSSDTVTQVNSYEELVTYVIQFCSQLIDQRYVSESIISLQSNQIFVFGSNEEGKHYGGSAKVAHEVFDAEWGVGEGPTGSCYALPTMQRPQTEAKEVIKCSSEDLDQSMKQFVEYARSQTQLQFLFTKVGCGVAGWGVEYMRQLFWKYVDPVVDTNILYPLEFEQ